MCGITGGIAQRDVAPILIEGLKRLEYRGYDSAGLAVVRDEKIDRVRVCGKVKELADKVSLEPLLGRLGIAHTRWATHGKPHELNAHPMMSSDNIAVVHNGIIENHETLREELKSLGYKFESQTDTEVVAHLIHHHYKEDHNLFNAVQKAFKKLHGACGL
jgi:glucosamine--fructose-6-phosphate aminotransferase (isomerizing)